MILDPLHGPGYQFWSGIGSGSPILAALVMAAHRHNCHHKGCWRLVRHGRTHCKHHEDDCHADR